MRTTNRYVELDQALCERIGEEEIKFTRSKGSGGWVKVQKVQAS